MASRKTVGVHEREKIAERRRKAREKGLCFHLCGRPVDPCGVCEGTGHLPDSRPTLAGAYRRTIKCGRCKGTGSGSTCYTCREKMRERKRAAS
jgi:DnaJ-class molecular chaperone